MDIIINIDDNGIQYSNESLLKGILHHTKFDGGFDGSFNGESGGFIGSGVRAETAAKLGFNGNPTQAECESKMVSFTLRAYPTHKLRLHKDLVEEVQSIYDELKKLGVQLNGFQGSYCYRKIKKANGKSGNALSMHALGCAIDINYNLNPYKDKGKPQASGDDTPRGIVRTMNSPIVKVFANHGWGWGGRYGDYMHFSKANGC